MAKKDARRASSASATQSQAVLSSSDSAVGAKAAASAPSGSVLGALWSSYSASTSQRLRMIDAYLAFTMLTGVLQFAYLCIVGAYPYNAFLAGFGSSVGSFVLAAVLRIQSNTQNREFARVGISPERAFADFVFCSIVLHLAVWTFMG